MNGPMRLRLVVAPDDVDRCSGELWAAGALGIEEQQVGSRRVALIASFTDPPEMSLFPDATEMTDPVRSAGQPFGEISRTGRFVVVPPWSEPPTERAADDVLISIDPGSAFGHGAHPTTRLVLAALEQVDVGGKRTTDLGCGSGVVAIAAALAGASSVVAVDNDPAAIDATRDNVAANDVGHRVEVIEADGARFVPPTDILVANVTIDIHERVAAAAAMSGASTIITSGILEEQLDRLGLAYPHHTASHRLRDGEWWAVVFERI